MARPIRLTADEVITAAKLAGVPPALALGVMAQESGGDMTAKSDKGAVGAFQLIPATFKSYGPPGGNINNPVDNMQAGLSYLADALRRSGGDWEGAAQIYYHGSMLRPGEQGPTGGPGSPTTRQYGQQVVARARQKAVELGLPTEEEDQAGPKGNFQNPVYNVPANRSNLISDYGLPPNNQYFMDQQQEKPYSSNEEGDNWYPSDNPEENDPTEEYLPEGVSRADLGNESNMPNFTPDQNMIPYDRFDPAVNMIGSNNYDMDRYIRRLVDEEFKSG